MESEKMQSIYRRWGLTVLVVLLLALITGCAAKDNRTGSQADAAEANQAEVMQPQIIPADVTCGKCGMYPARYPRWQAQIIFKDGTMTPFDGCKCMFNFLNAMDKYDQAHTMDDVGVAWVKDFNSGTWIRAEKAYFVVGSDTLGPMGKELIPFADKTAAMKFQQEQGGALMQYGDITPEVLGSLGMGGMKKHMKM
jgi:copper chaperone NosL